MKRKQPMWNPAYFLKPMPDSDNLLDKDGELYLIPAFLSEIIANSYFNHLKKELPWQQESLYIYGRWIKVPRLMCWHGDPGLHYKYSCVDHKAIAWTDALTEIKYQLEQFCNKPFNNVMANLYRNGNDSMGCHADDEKELGANPFIASLSLGEQRLLRFKHKTRKKKLDLHLNHGDLLVMSGNIQHHWQHELPKTKKAKSARINLTFRKIINS